MDPSDDAEWLKEVADETLCCDCRHCETWRANGHLTGWCHWHDGPFSDDGLMPNISWLRSTIAETCGWEVLEDA